MKKMIIAVAAVAMAACTQAASLDWKVTTGSDTYNGLTLYICSSGSDFESVDDIIAAKLGTGGYTATTAKKGSSMAPWYGANGTVVGIPDSAEAIGATVYAVIVSSDGLGYYSVAGSGDIYTTATTPATATINAATALAGDYTPFATTPPTPPGPSDVPEPTSGLLLVLGGAMLALRRRRA